MFVVIKPEGTHPVPHTLNLPAGRDIRETIPNGALLGALLKICACTACLDAGEKITRGKV